MKQWGTWKSKLTIKKQRDLNTSGEWERKGRDVKLNIRKENGQDKDRKTAGLEEKKSGSVVRERQIIPCHHALTHTHIHTFIYDLTTHYSLHVSFLQLITWPQLLLSSPSTCLNYSHIFPSEFEIYLADYDWTE